MESGTFIEEEEKRAQVNENTTALLIRCSFKGSRKRVRSSCRFQTHPYLEKDLSAG